MTAKKIVRVHDRLFSYTWQCDACHTYRNGLTRDQAHQGATAHAATCVPLRKANSIRH